MPPMITTANAIGSRARLIGPNYAGAVPGQFLTDEGSLQTAKINLGYAEIVAPISGRIGRTNITKGNVVGPDSGPLTVVVSQEPMYVTFPVSQRDFLRAQEDARQP